MPVVNSLLSDVWCSSIESLPHVSIEMQDTSSGLIAIFRCDAGFQFPDGRTILTAHCEGNGLWSIDVEQYKRKINISYTNQISYLN